MRMIIIGCGRMGAGLAQTLHQRGHSVTVVDRDPAAFAALTPSFRGERIVGIGFDRDVLLQAGIERADGLAAVTASDEANVVSARIARQIYRVPSVVARLYEPRKAEIYRRLGVQTISTTTWGINHVAAMLCYAGLDVVMSLGSNVDLVEVEAPPLLEGRTVKDLTVPGEIHIVALSRGGHTMLPTLGTTFRAGDRIHLATVAGASVRLHALLGQ
jgi:trk system potassium uptake protein TrkA